MRRAAGISAREKGRILLQGPRLTLRPVQKKDLTRRYVGWLNDPETTQFLETGDFAATLASVKAFCKGMAASKSDVLLAITVTRTGRHIGNIKLGGINWEHRFGDLGILIGDKRYHGKGYGSEACRLVLEYAFDQLNLKHVVLGVFGCHDAAMTLYKKLGFRVQGRLKGLYSIAGRSVDKVYMTVSKRTFIRS